MRHPISQSKKEETKKTRGRRRRHHQMVGVCVCIFEQKKKQRQCHVLFIFHEFSGTHPSIPILNMLSVMLCVHASVPSRSVQSSSAQANDTKKTFPMMAIQPPSPPHNEISSFFFFPRKPPRSGRTFYIQQMLGLFFNAFMIIIIVRRHHTIFTSSSQKEMASYPPKWPGCQSTWQDSAKQKQIWHY